jgi:hypothetical protein
MTVETITGKVQSIWTDADGTTTVVIDNGNGRAEQFKHPGEMTDKQLEEFKRAQSAKRRVGVEYETSPRKVRRTYVFSDDARNLKGLMDKASRPAPRRTAARTRRK